MADRTSVLLACLFASTAKKEQPGVLRETLLLEVVHSGDATAVDPVMVSWPRGACQEVVVDAYSGFRGQTGTQLVA